VNPILCGEILGQIVENTSQITEGCVTDEAAAAAQAIRNIGEIAAVAAMIGGITNIVTSGSIATGASSLFTYIPTVGRKANQLGSRGWTRNSINQLVNSPYATRTATNKATGNTATAYIRPDGHYVLRDNVTGELVQISDTRLSVGMEVGQWRPDSSIVNPVIPGGR